MWTSYLATQHVVDRKIVTLQPWFQGTSGEGAHLIPGWLLFLVSLGYAALLFTVAWWGDRKPLYPQRTWLRPVVYSLALAVYCSSWTFYGGVGTAVRHGIGYLPIYLGPLLLLLFGWRLIERLAQIARSENIVSIADFFSSRYGRSRRLGTWVALIALIGIVPYLALQYKAVAMSLKVLSGSAGSSGVMTDPALYVALLMALFATLFGTRDVDATEHHHGMMLAIALESVVKLLALVAVGLFAWYWLEGRGMTLIPATRALFAHTAPTGLAAQTLLSFLALLCLPRQFHVAVVECGSVADIRRARWLFGSYLILISMMIIPIAVAGSALYGEISTDALVLALPMSDGQVLLALIAYIGGFSAATGMVIVSSIALATMISNDLIMPLLLRRGDDHHEAVMAASRVLWIRRLAIFLLALVAYGYYRSSNNDTMLASYGLLAFAAVAQFAPGLIAGLYWRGASRRGVEAGLLVGFAVWAYTLLLPALIQGGHWHDDWLSYGPMGINWLRPQQLLGISGWDGLTHGTFWSLLLNSVVLLLVSARRPPDVDEGLRAALFLVPLTQRPVVSGNWPGQIQIYDLMALASRVIGQQRALRAFQEQAQNLKSELQPSAAADRVWVQFSERLLAASIGAASARLLLTSLLRGSGMDLGEVVAVLDEAGQELRFNREILSTTLENISAGVSVVDADMRLTVWNRNYQHMFEFPDGMLYVGRPIADLIRLNAERGKLGGSGRGDIEAQIQRRITHMRAGSLHVSESTGAGGQILELRGQPLPGGGYVTTYNDITAFRRAERALREVNETLEQRVALRSREAEQAQQSKSRFLAAISHDVLQPLNAARLFTSALRESTLEAEAQYLAERIDASLRAAEELLDGLLDVSRLDAGALRPEPGNFDASALLHELAAQYAPMAASRNIAVKVYARRHYVIHSDRRLLRRVLQNFLANALRYTRSGRIVLGMRPRAALLEVQVFDTGPGIPEHHLQQIFDEFHRYEQPFDWGEQGLGLGLSICQRISRLLDHRLHVRSRPGCGSMFSITVPRAQNPVPVMPIANPLNTDSLSGLKVLCVDNDKEILDGMHALLSRWHIEVITANTVDNALQQVGKQPDVVLVDYHLHDRLNGLATLLALNRKAGRRLPGALLTADGRDEIKQRARRHGYRILTKPVRPASLRAFLAALR